MLKKVTLWFITWYQHTLSPDHGPNHRATCRFIPTCSEYGKAAVEKYGMWGIVLTLWRILRCNPIITKAGTIDIVP